MGNRYFENHSDPPGRDLTGTYEFKRFFPAGCNEAQKCKRRQIGFYKGDWINSNFQVNKYFEKMEGEACTEEERGWNWDGRFVFVNRHHMFYMDELRVPNEELKNSTKFGMPWQTYRNGDTLFLTEIRLSKENQTQQCWGIFNKIDAKVRNIEDMY